MNSNNLKMRVFVNVLGTLEVLYLLTFIFILYARMFPGTEGLLAFTDIWLRVSYMVVPVLLFKNLLVSILSNGNLSKRDKVWIIVRSALYVLLAIYSYPLVASL